MDEIDLKTAVSEIAQVASERPKGQPFPFFLILGAGVSHPAIPLANAIEQECKSKALQLGRSQDPKGALQIDTYSHWLKQAYPNPEQRKQYLRNLMREAQISPAVFRIAHLLSEVDFGNLVVTPNFDDLLTRALVTFGKQPVVCDHPSTIQRLSLQSTDLQILHVHGTYWFYDCCNLKEEIAERARRKSRGLLSVASFLDQLFYNRAAIVVGYSGWDGDVITGALKRRLSNDLPFSIYWFCFRRSDKDRLPSWLRDHSGIRFVLPPAPTLASIESKVGKAMEETLAVANPLDLATRTLPAQQVFDALITAFGPALPLLTKEPLRFFADQLRRSLYVGPGDSDVYDLASVISRVERAQEVDSAVERKLEEIRNAIRESAYAKAVELVSKAGITGTSSETRELFRLAVIVASSIHDDLDSELKAQQLVTQLGRVFQEEGTADKEVNILIAKALLRISILEWEMDHSQESISAYDEVVRRLGKASEPALREAVAKAQFNKGVRLGQLGRSEEEIASYDEVVRRFGEASEPALREQVAMALVNKGVTLGQLGRSEEEVASYDEVVRRFGEASEPALREQVAKALVNRGIRLGQLERSEEAIASCDEVVRRFGEASEPTLREQAAKALVNKGVRLGQRGRSEEEVASYDEVVRRFGEASEPALREVVAKALVNKGIRLGQMERCEEAIASYDEVVRRFGEASEPALREQVAMAEDNKKRILGGG